MCHGYEWEMFKAAQMREIESRKREEKSKAESRAPARTPAQPAPAPSRNEEPVPV